MPDGQGRASEQAASLVLPDNPQLIEAGELLENLEALWEAATLTEKRDITRLLLEEMYVDVKTGTIVSIKPKAAFRLLLSDICADLGVEVL